MKINIDEYFIAKIDRCIKVTYKKTWFKFEKFAIIKNKIKVDSKFCAHYAKSLLTGEKYYLDDGEKSEGICNRLYVDPRYRLVSLFHVVESNNGKVKKKDFLKQCREIIITLNEEKLDDYQKHVIDKVKNKEKMLKLGNSKIKYEEEE